MFQIDKDVLLALVGFASGFLTLLVIVIRLLLKVTKQAFEAHEKLNGAYQAHSQELVNVIKSNNDVLTSMKISVDVNTKATEKSAETMDRLKDFVTQNIIQSTR